MASFIAIFTGLCGLKKKSQSSSLETTKREETSDDLHNKEHDDLQNKDSDDRDTNASDDDNINANPELSLPPARKAALQGTYSCNNMVIRKSMSTKKKLSASLTIQMPRSLSVAMKRDKEEDKFVKKKKMKAEKSILVRPIILGEKCRVLDEEEGDEDHKQRMPKHRIYHPRSLSSISISRTNSNIDANVIPVNETSEDLMNKEEK
ncbi:hypothetical protein V5N11_021265 [Cardamine amara subsp. amara]|uniref:Uncharacterized protein n=1 Tax=Cardamine amara subsp. amara TaxID=228776 RepID=A0ABD1BGQ2_CARAN